MNRFYYLLGLLLCFSSVFSNLNAATHESTTFDNLVDCPSELIINAETDVICSDFGITLAAVVEGGNNVSYEWSADKPNAGFVATNNQSTCIVNPFNSSCVPEVITYSLTVVCEGDNGTTILTDEIEITVYPNDLSAFYVVENAGNCTTAILVEPDCIGHILPTVDGQVSFTMTGGSTSSGFHEYTMNYYDSNGNILSECDLTSIESIPFNCAPVLGVESVETTTAFNLNNQSIYFESPTATQYTIVNIGGQQIEKGALIKQEQNRINIENLTPGIYIFYTDDGVYEKFLIGHW